MLSQYTATSGFFVHSFCKYLLSRWYKAMLDMHVKMIQMTVSDFLSKHNFRKAKNKPPYGYTIYMVLCLGPSGNKHQEVQGIGDKKKDKRNPSPVAQLVGASFYTSKVYGSIPSQGTHVGCRFHPRSGCIPEATNGYFSLASMLLPPPTPPPPASSLSKKIKHIIRVRKKEPRTEG